MINIQMEQNWKYLFKILPPTQPPEPKPHEAPFLQLGQYFGKTCVHFDGLVNPLYASTLPSVLGKSNYWNLAISPLWAGKVIPTQKVSDIQIAKFLDILFG